MSFKQKSGKESNKDQGNNDIDEEQDQENAKKKVLFNTYNFNYTKLRTEKQNTNVGEEKFGRSLN